MSDSFTPSQFVALFAIREIKGATLPERYAMVVTLD
jgi:hypothetical protein